ncbi:IS3 family transposase [Romboutsia sedimentorum]|uniref:IS3 family transposase n=1 Tax=Romboutsia sedimentorum TaxID=1368474 RepID=A0ABT7EF33_9FIRM|nr:IS3 family transposase [Romboutsia sedimentorum]MDK2564100.1 IS3 family transposase [Romboutsia sedimentorum]
MLHTIKKENLYTAIKELNQIGYPVVLLCKFSGIARSSYYKWLNKIESKRELENKFIVNQIIEIYEEVKGIYGYRRITMNLNRRLNKKYNHKRIYRLMKSINL